MIKALILRVNGNMNLMGVWNIRNEKRWMVHVLQNWGKDRGRWWAMSQQDVHFLSLL